MKKVKIASIALACLVFASALAGCAHKTPTNTDELKEAIDSVQSEMQQVAEQNSAQEVGEYVTPSESDFLWESVAGGVAITEYTGDDTAVVVPETLDGKSVVEIRKGAFMQSNVAGIKLPKTLTIVTDEAFFYCTTLVEVYLGENTEKIGGHAFEGCISLSRIHLNSTLKNIGECAFVNCPSLQRIELNDGLEAIERGAFCMSGLTEIVIPGSVKMIGEQAFTTCENLEKVEIKPGVQIIDETAFEACPNLKEARIPASVTEIRLRAFNQCEKLTIYAPAGSAAEAYATEDDIPFQAS